MTTWSVQSSPTPSISQDDLCVRFSDFTLTLRYRNPMDKSGLIGLALTLHGGGEANAQNDPFWSGADDWIEACIRVDLNGDGTDGSISLQGEVKAKTASTHPHPGVDLQDLVITIGQVSVGGAPTSFYKNGYQSWTATRSFQAEERERIPLLPAARLMQDNLANLASGRRGEFVSEMFTVLGSATRDAYLLVGQGHPFSGFLYLQASLPTSGDSRPSCTLRLVLDFGGRRLAPGAVVVTDPIHLMAHRHPNIVQDQYFERIRVPLRDEVTAQQHEGLKAVGWCSWYYYFTKVRAADILENLQSVLSTGQIPWEPFQIDDGYQTAVGDWLSLNDKFPDGLAPLAAAITDSGSRPGIWLAPFSARANSKLFCDHPQWFLKDDKGRPILAGRNPLWGGTGKFYALDTTHPQAQEYLREVVQTLVHRWGFLYLKLDFIYSAALEGRAHDPHLSRSQRLQLGLRIVREAAGPQVFLLGCGAPLAPCIGLVDGMRVGPDVAPYWSATYRYHLTRDPHALCTQFAIRNVLNRCQMHQRLWLNDPDCLLIRDTQTRLTKPQRMALANAIAITGGMLLLSDRLNSLPQSFQATLNTLRQVGAACFKGRTWALDIMDQEIPERIYNSAGYLAIFNLSGRPTTKRVSLAKALAGTPKSQGSQGSQGERWQSVWPDDNGRQPMYELRKDGLLDLGILRPYESMLLKRAGKDRA